MPVQPELTPKEVAEALAELPENRLICRGMQHAWDLEYDYHTHVVKRSKSLHLRRVWKCLRDCDVRVVEIFIVNKRSQTLERISRKTDYKHATGYVIKGIGRESRLGMIQTEMYRRAVRKAAGAFPGELDAPEA